MTQPASPTASEERQQRIEEKTSFGHYMTKQARQWGVMAAGVAGGFFAFKGLRNTKAAEKITELVIKFAGKKLPAEMEGVAEYKAGIAAQVKEYLPWIGGGIGLVGSSVVNTYDHWKNVESEKLAVSEINTDVGNLMQERARFSNTLARQESFIKDLIAQRQDGAKSAVDQLESTSNAASKAVG